jgi:hypothetical protein
MLTVIACCTDLIWGRLARLIAAVLGGLATLPGNLHAIGIPTTNMDRVAAALQQQARSGDLIVVNPWYQGLSFGRYYRGDADWTTLPILAEKRIHRFDLIKQKMQAVGPLDDLVVSTRSTLQAGGSVWIVGDLDPLPIRQPIKPLPPAPHGSAGWSEAAYQTNWSQQYTRFLQLAALSIDPVPVPGGVSFPEQASLSVARGWREPQPAAVRPAP